MRIGYMGNMESPNTRVWIEEMRARGVHAVAISQEKPSWGIEWAPLVIEPPRVRGIGLGRIEIARGLSRACTESRIDILHNHQANRHASWARLSGFRPRVITCWGSDVLRIRERSLAHRAAIRMALANADAITAGSAHLTSAAVDAGACRERCLTVGWGVDTQRFCRDVGSRNRLRTAWGLADRRILLSTRLLTSLYCVDSIVRAFSLALAIEPSLALVVAGEGPERERLERLAHDLGVAEGVRFLGGVYGREWPATADVYSGADVFCSIPLSDGGPLSVLEAMSSELPVVARDLPVMREWITPDETGLLWSGSDESELARLLLAALEQAEHMGTKARAYVCAEHERSREMDRVLGLYEQLMRNKGVGE